MYSIIKYFKDLNELILFKHSLFSFPFIFIAMIVSSNGWFGYKAFFLAILACVSARNFSMAFNRLVDMKYDIKNLRTMNRPSVDGRISVRQQIFFIGLNAIAFVFTSYLINYLAFSLAIPILFVLAFYSYLKRFTSLVHLFLGFCLSLAPIAGTILIEAKITFSSILLSLGVMFWVAGFDLLFSLQDMDFDKKLNLYSIPSKYGLKFTVFLAKFFHTLTIIFWTLFAFFSNLGLYSYFGIVISAFILIYEHYIVSKNLDNIPKAFFDINAYLGIIFLLFIILDKVL